MLDSSLNHHTFWEETMVDIKPKASIPPSAFKGGIALLLTLSAIAMTVLLILVLV